MSARAIEQGQTTQLEPSFWDDSKKGEPMAQTLSILGLSTGGSLMVIGIKSLAEGDYGAAAASLGPMAAELGLYELIYSAYKKLPQDKREEVKRKATLVNEKINQIISKGVELGTDAAGVALGFIFTAGGAGGLATHLIKPDPLQAGAAFLMTAGGMLSVYEGVTGEVGRHVFLGKPRKYPFVLDRISHFISELPKPTDKG